VTRPISQRLADLIEDVEWMLTGAESLAGAAVRLAMTEQTLADTLTHAGRSDLVTRLRGRVPATSRQDHAPAYIAAYDNSHHDTSTSSAADPDDAQQAGGEAA
jgi:hypothetical protein